MVAREPRDLLVQPVAQLRQGMFPHPPRNRFIHLQRHLAQVPSNQ